MTDQERLMIEKLRNEGNGYKKISLQTGISISTVKSYCKRTKLKEENYKLNSQNEKHFCRCCGRELDVSKTRREKLFCDDNCRLNYWKMHREQLNKKAIYNFVCIKCGKPFLAYGNAKRKYCSCTCYRLDRYGERCNGK